MPDNGVEIGVTYDEIAQLIQMKYPGILEWAIEKVLHNRDIESYEARLADARLELEYNRAASEESL